MLNKTRICQERLKEVLHYNPENGEWAWLATKANQINTGDSAGCISGTGYRYIKVDGIAYKSSRLAWLYQKGYFPEHDIDHKDRVRDNDIWTNLRHVTRSCNTKNSRIRSDNSTGVVGVSFSQKYNSWRVRIDIAKKTKSIGSFPNFIDAVRARYEAEKKYDYLSCKIDSSAFNYLKQNNKKTLRPESG